jgi:two-component system phosphate regulon sensor histidine kinase PhoR
LNFWIILSIVLNLVFFILIIKFNKKLKTQKQEQNRRLSNIFHDLKIPLTSVLGFSELLESSKRDDATHYEFIEIIHSEAEKVLHMIDELTSESVESKNLNDETTDCVKVLKDICRSSNFFAEKENIKIKFNSEENLFAKISEIKFWRVASNLITNAIKYNKNGGTVIVDACSKDDFIVVKVKDTGIGIKHKNISNVFKRGFREHSDNTGFGFGLFNVRKILEIHGGKIKLESEIEKGSEFTIFIPEVSCTNIKKF